MFFSLSPFHRRAPRACGALASTALCLAAAFGCSAAQAAPPPAKATVATVATSANNAKGAPRFVRELGGIAEYRLLNGLQVLLFPDDAQSTTTVNITYRVGSRHESPGEYGMAHLLEHLLFKGTPRHRDIPEAYARLGMRFNGSTTADRTNYFTKFNANARALDFALSLEADRMVNSFVAKSDLDSEMTVVRNEYERGENEPFEVLNQRVLGTAYDWHNYGHDPIGPKSDIENVPIEKLQAFYKRFYRPDNATLMVAGRFDAKATLARIAQLYGPLPVPAAPIPRPYTVEPAQDGERSVVVRRIGGQPLLMAYYHVPAQAHPDSAPLLVLGLLLSLQPSGQLYQELVDTKQALAASLSGMGDADPGGIRAVAVLPPDADVDQVQRKLLDLVEGRAGRPFTEAELDRVRTLALTSYQEQMKAPEGLIQQISDSGATDWRLLFQLMEDLPRVTLADVERVRQAYLRPANRTVGRYLPAQVVERVEIPTAPTLDQRLAGLKGPPKVEAGERFDPTPRALGERTTARKLPSGIKLISLAKRTRGDTVNLTMHLRWGERVETYQHRGTALVASLMREGSQTTTRQQMEDRLTQLNAGMRISSGDQGATLTIQAEKGSLLEVLKIAADAMRRPLFPADAFERFNRAGLAQLESSRQGLETLRQAAVREHYNRARGAAGLTNPAYIPTVDEQVALARATTLDDVKRFYADYWSANDATVAVVGAMPDGLDVAIEQLFGEWKKPKAPAYVRHADPAKPIPSARFDAIARDKTSAEMRMSWDFALNDRDPDYLPLAVAVHIFGGGGMEDRLSTRVRRQAGLTYGIGASLQASHFGDAAVMHISGSFAPQNREQLLSLVGEELRRMTNQGITEAELTRAKKDLLEGARQSLADNGRLTQTLLTQADQHETWADVAAREARLASLTVAQVNAAWRKRVKLDGFVTSTVGDFKDKP